MSDAKVFHGECLAVMRTLEAESVDAVITDPPYSSGGAFRGDRAGLSTRAKYVQSGTSDETARPDFGGDTRDQRGYFAWATLWLSECHRLVRGGGAIVVFADWRQLPVVTDAIQAADFIWRGIAVWDKTEGVRPQAGRFRAQCEYMVWGSKGPMPIGGPVHPGCFRVSVIQNDKHHRTGKPVELMRGLVRIARPGGIILDPFMGSGTTGVACRREGRGFIGIERDPEYFAIAKNRVLGAEPESDPLFAEVSNA